MKKIQKGEFGYILYQRKKMLLITIIGFVISILIFLLGIYTTGSNKNILSIVAVLGLLPASKNLVSTIMYFKAKPCTESLKAQIDASIGTLLDFYDLYFTSYKTNYQVSHMVLTGNTICGITEDAACDTNGLEAHLEQMLKQDGLKGFTIKIFKDTTKYCNRLEQLVELDADPSKYRDDVIRTLSSVSL